MGDTHASDGSDLAPGETHVTARGFPLRPATPEEVASLDQWAALPDSPIIKVDGHYCLREPVDVHFDADSYFSRHNIDPNAEYQPGVTFRDEYNRQLRLQQSGMNDLSVGEWEHNVRGFEDVGRLDSGQSAARAQAGGQAGDGMAVLHGPVLVAGGRPETFDGLGDSGVNSSIGRRWQENFGGLRRSVTDATAGVPPDLLRFVHVNVRLLPG
jgi:hypothetical protein